MKIKEQLKKLYNKLDFATVGLDNRIIAAHGLNILLIILPSLIYPIYDAIINPGIICFMTIPIAIGYIAIKITIKYLAPKFKMLNPNISIYLLAVILFAITCYIFAFWLFDYIPFKDYFVIHGFMTLIALLFKTPFLPKCKLKHFQEKLEKNVIKISFIAFFIMSILMTSIIMPL